ncbi:DoxX family protein [Gordonia defluvii]|jgi:putative oxidoreductase|uniref:DoxX family protein n=1 Tax=Gordonia defluvii TaxID=283718 RepID=A0ABP6L3Q8_9ACTN|nr:DoxX family protein [Gordonia sp. UBA5067]
MTSARTATQLLLRITLGVVFVAHGWEKLHIKGVDKTAMMFDKHLHIPFPAAAAHFATWAELLGGLALIVGVLLPYVGVLLAATMIGAGYYGHHDKGFWIQQNGWEFNLVLAVAVLAVGFAAPGAAAVDHYVGARRRTPATGRAR